MTAGKLTAFLMYVRMMYNPVITISRRYDQTQRTLTAALRVFELLDTMPEIRDRRGAETLSSVEGAVRFEDVSFRYRPDQPGRLCYAQQRRFFHLRSACWIHRQ